MNLLEVFGRAHVTRQDLWEPIMMDMDHMLKFGTATNHDIYHIMRALHAVSFLDEGVVRPLVDYLVKRGYDSDELIKMSTDA